MPITCFLLHHSVSGRVRKDLRDNGNLICNDEAATYYNRNLMRTDRLDEKVL